MAAMVTGAQRVRPGVQEGRWFLYLFGRYVPLYGTPAYLFATPSSAQAAHRFRAMVQAGDTVATSWQIDRRLAREDAEAAAAEAEDARPSFARVAREKQQANPFGGVLGGHKGTETPAPAPTLPPGTVLSRRLFVTVNDEFPAQSGAQLPVVELRALRRLLDAAVVRGVAAAEWELAPEAPLPRPDDVWHV